MHAYPDTLTEPSPEILEIIEATQAGSAVLFLGAGATISGGGLRWSELADYVCATLGEKPGPTPADTFEEICDIRGRRQEAYELVARRLENVTSSDDLKALLRLPWLAIWTTNYDTAIEEHYHTDKLRTPFVVRVSDTFFPVLGPSEIPIFKLMGSRDRRAGETGEMILSRIDLAKYQNGRGDLVRFLDSFVSARLIVTVGYSYDDLQLADSVRRVRALNQNRACRVIALIRSGEPSPEAGLLSRFGVRFIQGGIGELATTVKSGIKEGGQSVSTTLRFRGKPLTLDARGLRDLERAYEPITEDACTRPQKKYAFLRGKTSELGAYEERFPWTSPAFEDATRALGRWANSPDSDVLILDVVGGAGSGRTVCANFATHYAVTSFASAGIRVPEWSPHLDELGASQLAEELKRVNPNETGQFVTVLSRHNASVSELRDFSIGYVTRAPAGVRLLVVRTGDTPLGATLVTGRTIGHAIVRVEDSIPPNRRGELADYILALGPETVKGRWTVPSLTEMISAEPSFIDVMYKAVDPTARSLTDIVHASYESLGATEQQAVVCLVLAHVAKTAFPISLLSRSLRTDYPTAFEILDRCSELATVIHHDERIHEAMLYHWRVGQILLHHPQIKQQIGAAAKWICSKIELPNAPEYEFSRSLLMGRGLEASAIEGVVSREDLREIFRDLAGRDSSGVYSHHFALLLRDEGKIGDALRALDRAQSDVAVYLPGYSERPEVITTSLAQVLWMDRRRRGGRIPIGDPDVMKIRALLRSVRSRRRPNPHSYDIEASILDEISELSPLQERAPLQAEAIGTLREGISMCGGNDKRLVDHLAGILAGASAFSEDQAAALLKDFGSGEGYYLLAELAAERHNGFEADRLLSIAAAAPIPSVPALRTSIHAILSSPSPDYQLALTLSSKVFDAQFDSNRQIEPRWKDYLQRIVCLVAVGIHKEVPSLVRQMRRLVTREGFQTAEYFLYAQGSRQTFRGRVLEISAGAGRIGRHNVIGFPEELYFSPREAKATRTFQVGEPVRFNLGFGSYGPLAWDVAAE